MSHAINPSSVYNGRVLQRFDLVQCGGLQGRGKVNETKVTLLEEIYALKWDLPLLLDVQRLTISNDNYKCSKPTVSDCVPDCVASLHAIDIDREFHCRVA